MEHFEFFKDKKSEYRFNVIAANNKVVAISEGYKTLQSAKKTAFNLGKIAKAAAKRK